MVVITVILFLTQRGARDVDRRARRADPRRAFDLVPPRVGEGLPARARPHRQRLADLSESLYGIRVVTANNRQRRNIRNHRHVVGAYRDANATPVASTPSTVRRPHDRHPGPGHAARHRRRHGAAPPPQASALMVFFLYLNRFFAPIQLLVQQYTTLQQGRSSIIRLRELLETAPTVDEVPGAKDLPTIEGRITFEHVTSATCSDEPSCTTSTWRSPRASPSPSSDRPAPASRPWPSWPTASTTPRGPGAARRHRRQDRHPALACAHSWASCPRRPSSSPVPSAPT
jgi:hypothetical protein